MSVLNTSSIERWWRSQTINRNTDAIQPADSATAFRLKRYARAMIAIIRSAACIGSVTSHAKTVSMATANS